VKHVDEMPLAEAAKALGISWHRAWRLLLVGALDGRRDRISGRWLVQRSSVERVKRANGERPLPAA
jgi:molybdenum-dependent DNA-binding transcriptional regulator ModE